MSTTIGHSDQAPEASAKAERTILVVDDDRVARRYLEVTLSRLGSYRIEVANDAKGALDMLRTSVVDLILSDINMPDMDGFQFLQRVRRDSRCRNLPFIFISSDARVATKVGGLQMGIDDYITKPFEVSELKARIESIFRRADASRAAAHDRSYNLAGDFTGIPFPELINILNMGCRTGKLTVVTSRAGAVLFFEQGRLVHATFGNVEGVEAFHKMMSEPQGHFEFAPGALSPDVPRTIATSCSGLLLEAARRQDSNGHAAGAAMAGATGASPVSLRPTGMPAPRSTFISATPPNAVFVAELETTLADAFALGELQFFTADSLRQWTVAPSPYPLPEGEGIQLPHARERFHILLVTGLSDGVSSLTALAAPLGEGQIFLALSAEKVHALGLTFLLRDERMADVVLIDQRQPEALGNALLRVPSAVIVAPAGGDWLTFGTAARTELVALLKRLTPAVLLGVGNAALQASLEEMKTTAALPMPVLCIGATLGDAGTDLREILVETVQFWASAVPGENRGTAFQALNDHGQDARATPRSISGVNAT